MQRSSCIAIVVGVLVVLFPQTTQANDMTGMIGPLYGGIAIGAAAVGVTALSYKIAGVQYYRLWVPPVLGACQISVAIATYGVLYSIETEGMPISLISGLSLYTSVLILHGIGSVIFYRTPSNQNGESAPHSKGAESAALRHHPIQLSFSVHESGALGRLWGHF